MESPAKTTRWLNRPIWGGMCCLLLTGCANPDDAIGFQEANPAARLRAIRQAGERQDRGAIPGLIEQLDSDDPAARVLAIRTLEEMTGQTLGYDHSAGPDERRAATRRWTEWYSQQPGMTTNRVGERGSGGGSV